MVIRSFCSSTSMRAAWVFGRSTSMPVVIIGALTMKMINSTSITSTSGVTLISLRGPLPPPPLNAIGSPSEEVAPNDVEQVAREAVHLARQHVDATHEVVVGHDRRDRRGQPDRGRDQRLGDTGCDDVQAGVLLCADAHERIHDAPDRAEQPDERRGRAGR